MDAIKNTLTILNENWTNILIIVGLLAGIYTKTTSYLKNANEKRVEIAKKAVKENMLKYISEAQIEWKEFSGSGEIKRSQVIGRIYEDYPILKEYIKQEELIRYIDELIVEGLKTVLATIDPALTTKEGE